MEIWWCACDEVIQTGRELLSCAYTTQLLHSTVEVCLSKYNIYFIWINLCAETPDKYLPGGPGSGPV